jgi:flagellar assembly protein FliH
MAEALKFNFINLETQNAGQKESARARGKKRVYNDEQITEIQNASFSEGLAAGEAAALTRVEQRIAATLDQIRDQYENLLADAAAHISSNLRQSAELALDISNALIPELIARQPIAEIEKLFVECIAHLKAEPRIVIRIEEALIDQLKKHIDHIAHQAGYPGKVILIADPDALPAQCQIEWSDGGVTHRSREQQALIERKVLDYVSCYGISPEDTGERECQSRNTNHTKPVFPKVMDNE